MQDPVAVLPTTVLPLDGLYAVASAYAAEAIWPIIECSHRLSAMVIEALGGLEGRGVRVRFEGVPHYIGHPDTKKLIEERGATPAQERLFPGLQVGEAALTVAIKQGRSSRTTLGHTEAHQAVTWEDLEVRVVMRVA